MLHIILFDVLTTAAWLVPLIAFNANCRSTVFHSIRFDLFSSFFFRFVFVISTDSISSTFNFFRWCNWCIQHIIHFLWHHVKKTMFCSHGKAYNLLTYLDVYKNVYIAINYDTPIKNSFLTAIRWNETIVPNNARCLIKYFVTVDSLAATRRSWSGKEWEVDGIILGIQLYAILAKSLNVFFFWARKYCMQRVWKLMIWEKKRTIVTSCEKHSYDQHIICSFCVKWPYKEGEQLICIARWNEKQKQCHKLSQIKTDFRCTFIRTVDRCGYVRYIRFNWCGQIWRLEKIIPRTIVFFSTVTV